LGNTTYTQDELLNILSKPPRGDASLILAEQLIAALLDIMINGTDSSPVAKTIADANSLLATVGPLPLLTGIKTSSPLGQQMVADAAILDDFVNGKLTQACGSVVPTGSCQPSSSLSVLVSGTNVTSYVPKGSWSVGSPGVSVVNIEGSSITPTLIPTATDVVNSCASNALTGQTVCTANNNHVLSISGTTLNSTVNSGGTLSVGFSGGSCTNCGVAMDATNNRAVIGLSIAGVKGFQFVDLSTTPPSFPALPFASPSGNISEDPLIDPIRNFLLSASESNNYEIVDVSTTTPAFFEHPVASSGLGELDSSGEDCSTGIALAPGEFSAPSQVFLADLTQASFTPGSPAGTWTTPVTASQIQTLTESFLAAGASGIAVAQGTHTAVISGEFGGDAVTAGALPSTSGSGTPAFSDWVTCRIGSGFSNGLDPHTVTAYQSPSSGDAIALLANGGATTLAVVDLTKMLNPTIVARTVAGHGCASGTLPATVVSFVTVP
jgi:hypothetical protein